MDRRDGKEFTQDAGAKDTEEHLQDGGRDTLDANLDLGLPADAREYGTGAQILTALGLRKIRLLQHAPRRVVDLEGYGLEIVEQVQV